MLLLDIGVVNIFGYPRQEAITHTPFEIGIIFLLGCRVAIVKKAKNVVAFFGVHDTAVVCQLIQSAGLVNVRADRRLSGKYRPETCAAMLREARGLYEYILDHCSDEHLLAAAERSMYDLLVRTGEYDAAEEYLRQMPDLWQSRQIAALDHPKNRREACVTLAADAVHLLQCALDHMVGEDGGFSPEERAEITANLESMNRLFSEGRSGVPSSDEA